VGTESVITAWREISLNQGGPQIFSLRAGNVIGGGDRARNRLLPDIVSSKLSGNSLEVRNPKSTRPWQHVLDPLQGYLMALEKSLSKQIAPAYNFGPTSKSLTVDNAIDASLSSKELNWRPRWSQEDAVKSTINWWRQVSEGTLTPYQACVQNIEFLLA
jgi:CDP-glucose 4,6-dehydratase